MPLQLAFCETNGSVSEHILYEGRAYTVGRDKLSDIMIVHPQVSRHHASISTNQEHWQLDDVSTTGCFQNGQKVAHLKINQEQTLHFGPIPCHLRPLEKTSLVRLDSQHLWRKRQLLRFENQLNRCADTGSLVHLARECLTQSLGCERAALILFDDIQRFQVSLGFEAWMAHESFTGSRSIIQHVAKTRTVKALGNIVADKQFSDKDSVVRFGIQAAICVPVQVGDDNFGVLYADSIEGRRYFTQTDIAFAQSLAHQLSLRLLYHKIEQKLQRINLV